MTADTQAAPVSTREVRDVLRRYYKPKEWAVTEEVPTQGRSIDLVAVNLWQSRGYLVIGHEIKSSRSDWLRELANPVKGEESSRHCDAYYLVAPRGVAHLEEVPADWGFLEYTGRTLQRRRQAPTRETTPTHPREVTAMLMRAAAARDHSAVDARIKAAEDAARTEAYTLLCDRHAAEMDQLRRWNDEVRHLAHLLGCRPNDLIEGRVTEQVAAFLQAGMRDTHRAHLTHIQRYATALLDSTAAQLGALDHYEQALTPPEPGA